MARVVQADVREVITSDKLDIQPFITAANLLITDLLGSSGLATAQLKEIERWLSAHFLSMAGSDSDAGEVTSEEIGETKVEYATGQSLSSSRYGKQAILLDTTGKLARLGKGTAQFRVFGPDFTV